MRNPYDFYITPEEYEIAAENGICRNTLDDRIRLWAWTKERALTEKPVDLSEWVKLAEENGISKVTFWSRRAKGWDLQRAATEKINSDEERIRKMNHKRRVYPIEYVNKAKRNGISYNTFKSRMRLGMSLEEAATKPIATPKDRGTALKMALKERGRSI